MARPLPASMIVDAFAILCHSWEISAELYSTLRASALVREKRICTWGCYSSLENTICYLDLMELPSSMFQKQPNVSNVLKSIIKK
jgi:hypothetical protein